MYDKDMRPDYHEYDKVPPHGRPENGPACPHDTYGNPQCPPHDFYGFHGTLGPGYHLLPVPPNTWGLTTEQQLLALGGKVDELIRTFNEYDRKIYGAWDAVVNSALSNDAYYKDITVEDGYIGDTGAKYKVVHIPYTDKAGQPIYLELGVPYNNTTNAGLTEECFDASERTLADKLVPAVNAGTGFTGLAMFKHAPIEGTPMPMSMPAPGSSGWTLGITENGYLKLYDTANSTYDNLKWDNVRNAMGVVGLLVNNREKANSYYADNKGDTLARVGIGMNYDTKERFIVVVQGDDTHGTTSDLLADIFVRYNCNVAVETANSGSAFGMDKGEMMFMPPTTTITLGIDGAPNVPHTGAFWYITKRRHYHNEYVKDVATLMQRLGRHVWSAKIYSKSIDDVEASVKDLGLKLNEEAKAREEKDNEIQRQIDEEILGREGGDTEVEDKLNAAIPKLEKQIQDAVTQLNQQISEEAEKRENADVKEIQTTLDGNKRTYTLVLKDESTIEVPVETYDYAKLTQRLTDIFNFEDEFRDFYSKYSAWKQTIDETYDSMETLLNSTVQRVGQNETDISALKTTANQLREQMTALDQTVASFQAQIVQMELSVEDLKQAWTKYHTAWSQFVTEYNTWKSETDTKVQNHESRIATLEREYAEQESRITVVEQTVQTQHEHLQRVDQKDAEQDDTLAEHTQQISDIQQKDSEQDKQIADLQTADISHEARMEFLQTADEKLDARVKQTETDIAGVSGRVTANAQAIQSHAVVLAGIAGSIDDINKTDADLQKQITEIDNKETANAESINSLQDTDEDLQRQITAVDNKETLNATNIGALQQDVAETKARQDVVESKVENIPDNVSEEVGALSTKVDSAVQLTETMSGRLDSITLTVANDLVKKSGDTMTGALSGPDAVNDTEYVTLGQLKTEMDSVDGQLESVENTVNRLDANTKNVVVKNPYNNGIQEVDGRGIVLFNRVGDDRRSYVGLQTDADFSEGWLFMHSKINFDTRLLADGVYGSVRSFNPLDGDLKPYKVGEPEQPTHAATKKYVDDTVSKTDDTKVSKSGDTMTGSLQVKGDHGSLVILDNRSLPGGQFITPAVQFIGAKLGDAGYYSVPRAIIQTPDGELAVRTGGGFEHYATLDVETPTSNYNATNKLYVDESIITRILQFPTLKCNLEGGEITDWYYCEEINLTILLPDLQNYILIGGNIINRPNLESKLFFSIQSPYATSFTIISDKSVVLNNLAVQVVLKKSTDKDQIIVKV